MTRRPPAALWLPAAAVTAVLALPLVYLVVRVLGAADPLEVLGVRARSGSCCARWH